MRQFIRHRQGIIHAITPNNGNTRFLKGAHFTRGAAVPTFNPVSLFAAGEQGVFFDPSDLTTMFQDRAGTIHVTADGQTIGHMLDKSGNGNHWTAPSDAARPLYKTSGGYHWAETDGTDDSFSTGSIDFTSTDKMSIFAGVSKTSGGGFQTLMELGTGGSTENSFSIFAPNAANDNYDFRLCTNPRQTASSYSPPITNVLTCIHDISQSAVNDETKVRINGAAVTTTGTIGQIGNFINASIYIGRRNNASFSFNGKIRSIIVRGSLSTTQEISDTEAWVNGKTGAY